MSKKPPFWIGSLVFVSLVSIGSGTVDAQTKAKSKRPAVARAAVKAPARQRTLYSATRALSRKASLARARALAMAREIAETTLPRYKVDASGDLVPDVRAAAAIIYDPETNEILWEENSQSQRSIASITKVMTATVFLRTIPMSASRSPSHEAMCSRPRRRI